MRPLLLALPALVVAVPAQEVAMAAACVPGVTDARIDGATASAIVALCYGSQAGATLLPSGVMLDLDAPAIATVGLADAGGSTFLSVPFPANAYRGLPFVAQAVAWNAALSLDQPGALVVSAPQPLRVPAIGDEAEVYVLFGQSNAEGQAEAALLPAALRGRLPRCRIWNDGAAAFQALHEGVNTRTASPASWCGPELALARGLTAKGRTVWLVKLALGATALGPTPGPWNEWGVEAGELYAVLMFRVAAACNALRQQGLAPRVRGICMMQGESDATDADQAAGYRPRLLQLVDRMRADLLAAGDAGAEPVPFVLGLIHRELPASFFPFVARVRAAQAAVVAARPAVRAVETSGLSLLDDGVHLSTAGVVQLGELFAAALTN
ncbi:MAG: sialate O-acetylesterase [Planctomycetota bacterium]